MTTLVTGFEPFGSWPVNPSAEVARALSDVAVTAVLPVDFVECPRILRGLLVEHRPDIVLCLGLSAGSTAVEWERVAINLIDAAIPDNVGNQLVDEPVVPGGPDAFFTTLPVKTIVSAIAADGLPATLSLSAGTYGCNEVMYAALEWASRQPESSRPRCGFAHLPLSDDMSLADQERAIRIALGVAGEDDQSWPGGRLA